jgi:hypothetical protein
MRVPSDRDLLSTSVDAMNRRGTPVRGRNVAIVTGGTLMKVTTHIKAGLNPQPFPPGRK